MRVAVKVTPPGMGVAVGVLVGVGVSVGSGVFVGVGVGVWVGHGVIDDDDELPEMDLRMRSIRVSSASHGWTHVAHSCGDVVLPDPPNAKLDDTLPSISMMSISYPESALCGVVPIFTIPGA